MNYKTDEALQKPIARKPNAQKQALNNNENQEACQQQQIESENQGLHLKLASKEEQIDQLTEQNKQLSTDLTNEKEKNQKLQSSFNQFKESVDIKKLLAIGMSLINNLAKPTDMSELNIFEVPIGSEDLSEKVF